MLSTLVLPTDQTKQDIATEMNFITGAALDICAIWYLPQHLELGTAGYPGSAAITPLPEDVLGL